MPDKLTAIADGKSIPLPQTDELLLRKAHYLLRALDHDLRIKMLYFLHQKQQCTVTEINPLTELNDTGGICSKRREVNLNSIEK